LRDGGVGIGIVTIEEGTEVNVVNIKDYSQFSNEKMKKQNVFQSPRFFCDVYGFEPGQEQKGHVHADQDKVYLVLEGEGTFRIGNESRILGEGQGTMAPAGEEHGVVNHTTHRLRVLVFMAPNPG
jgi:quercetin dioxygenase-like cupin family protein